MSCEVLPGLEIFIGRKRRNQNISYIQDFTVDQYQQCLSWKVRSIPKWSNKNFLRDNSTRRCNWDVFFIKKVLFFSPEDDIFVRLKIDWRTVLVVRFSVYGKNISKVFSQIWRLNFFFRRNVCFSKGTFVTSSLVFK